MAIDPVEQHTRNLRFRDNRTVFNDSARWLDSHRDEALPVMAAALAEEGPSAIGVARVLGRFDDPRAVPALARALRASDDALAFEAARALAATNDATAVDALREAARGDAPSPAVRGIELRGDPALCDVVLPLRSAEDPTGAYARRAAAALGCEAGE